MILLFESTEFTSVDCFGWSPFDSNHVVGSYHFVAAVVDGLHLSVAVVGYYALDCFGYLN